jgi:osmotically inducible lipoprotein OsmB
MKRIIATGLVMVFLSTMIGCAGMSDQQQRTMSGGVIGAAGGAGIAAIAGGNVGVGAAVGVVAGGLTGYIIGEKKKQQ